MLFSLELLMGELKKIKHDFFTHTLSQQCTPSLIVKPRQ